MLGLNLTASRYGALALLVLLAWVLAIAAFSVLSVAWLFNRRVGRTVAMACCAVGMSAMVVFPIFWPRDFVGALAVELFLTSPSVLLAIYLVRYHSGGGGCKPRST